MHSRSPVRPASGATLGAAFALVLLPAASPAQDGAPAPRPVEAALAGLRLAFDPDSGALVRMSHPGPGAMLEADPGGAGLLDLAYPVPRFEPLRLAARFSRGARIRVETDAVTVEWDRLGASRPLELSGPVSAAVRFRAAADGQSILLTASVRNGSDAPVRQAVFPDFRGLLPFAGPEGTQFRTCWFVAAPFASLRVGEGDQFYAQDASAVEYTPGGTCLSPMVGRWFDLGGLRGGFSLFPRRWGWDPQVAVAMRRSEADGKLRLGCVHPVEIAPGASWESGEFVLTPHAGGWARGIGPYREWVRQNAQRPHPVPERVRRGLGYRTVWMCQNQPEDGARDAVWTFQDLPGLADDARAHGLDEMVLWAWGPAFRMPIPPPFPHLGTEEDLVHAVAECKKRGVNVSLFISVLQAHRDTAGRYGLTVRPGTGNWSYHTEMMPRFAPPFAANLACVAVPQSDPQWQEDVLASCRRLVDLGLPSIAWDQFWPTPAPPDVTAVLPRVRAHQLARDPDSTFGGEEVSNMEISCRFLDYTWNWIAYRDCQAFTSAFPAPRVNANINRSVEQAKLAFADNLYLNVWPRKPDGINGSDRIANDAALSGALKRCAALRARFLPYFTEGTFAGDGALAEPAAGAHVATYVRPDRLLVVAVNRGGPRRLELALDLAGWLPSPSGRYAVRAYGEDGAPAAAFETPGDARLASPRELARWEIVLFEATAAGR